MLEVMRRGVAEPLPEEGFDALALRVFRWQFETNPVYRRYAEARSRTPASVRSWQEVPPVPTRAFKSVPLVSGGSGEVERVFRTSGTTRGRQSRGEHHVKSLALYRASLLPAFQANVLPDGARLPILSLVPSPETLTDSSLSFMVGAAMDALGAEGSGWFSDASGGPDVAALEMALREHEEAGRPVLLVGTAFAFVHWLGAAERGGWRFRLAEGSRLLETGGFKGRSRAVSREALYGALSETLGLPVSRMLNEYGMTELLSQYYEPLLDVTVSAGSTLAEALALRRHLPPPWMRARVLDPVTLEPVPRGERGLICHHDLANVHSLAVVLTEDLGELHDDGLRLLGRFPGAEPRGCSLTMKELLSAAERA